MGGRLDGRVAIITGAGQGIGLAYAERFLAEGARVMVADVDEARGAAAAEALAGRGEIAFVRTDISDPASAEACVSATVERFGTLDVLVNNAAIYHDIDHTDASLGYLEKVTAVNQHGTWLMARAAAPVMVAKGRGRIVNQASGAAYSYSGFPTMDFHGLSNFSYPITKWGVVGLTKFMAAQLGQYGITVNCIAPGITMTEATVKTVPEEFLAIMTSATALRSRLEPEDLAGAAVFFASDDARFCTGQTLVIDGGLAMPA